MNKDLVKKSCTECGGKLEYRLISQGFERGGIKVRLGGIKAYVCSTCKEIYFMPGGADKVAKAANALFELAKAERQHKGQLNSSDLVVDRTLHINELVLMTNNY